MKGSMLLVRLCVLLTLSTLALAEDPAAAAEAAAVGGGDAAKVCNWHLASLHACLPS